MPSNQKHFAASKSKCQYTEKLASLDIFEMFYFTFISSFRKLKRLNLGGNELTAVPQKALSIFDNLKKLEIQENKIRVIKEGDFEGRFILESASTLNSY